MNHSLCLLPKTSLDSEQKQYLKKWKKGILLCSRESKMIKITGKVHFLYLTFKAVIVTVFQFSTVRTVFVATAT